MEEVPAVDLVSAIELFRAVSEAHMRLVSLEAVLLPETMFDQPGPGTALANGVMRDRMRRLNRDVVVAHARKSAARKLQQILADSPLFPLRCIDPGNGEHPAESSEAAAKFSRFLEEEIRFQSSFLASLVNRQKIRANCGLAFSREAVESQCFLNLVYFFREEAIRVLESHSLPHTLANPSLTRHARATIPSSATGNSHLSSQATNNTEPENAKTTKKRDRMTPLQTWIAEVMSRFHHNGQFVPGARGLVWEALCQIAASKDQRPPFVIGFDQSVISYKDPKGEVQDLHRHDFGRKFDALRPRMPDLIGRLPPARAPS